MRRVVSVWLPTFATDRLRRTGRLPASAAPAEAAPRVTVGRVGRRRVVVGADAAAYASGVRPGDVLARAQARVPALVALPSDPEADAAALTRLANWASRYTPLASADPPDGLWLDTTGCDHLHGGEATMLADLRARLEQGGYASRAAVADTPGCAHAVARHGMQTVAVVPRGLAAMVAALDGLPVEALRLSGEALYAVRRIGVDRVGMLRAQMRSGRGTVVEGVGRGPLADNTQRGPSVEGLGRGALVEGVGREPLSEGVGCGPLAEGVGRGPPVEEVGRGPPAEGGRGLLVAEAGRGPLVEGVGRGPLAEGVGRGPLARRLGAAVVARLDQALGQIAEPLTPLLPSEAISHRLSFAEPLSTPESLAAAVAALVEAVCGQLERAGRGALRLDLVYEAMDQSVQAMRVGTARPTRAAAHLTRILTATIDRVEAERGIERIHLVASLTDALTPAQTDSGGSGDADVAELVDRLVARLGAEAVWRSVVVARALPEEAVARLPPLATAAPGRLRPAPTPPRPLRLLDPPQPIDVVALLPNYPPAQFTWRRQRHRVRRADGPERLVAPWWSRGEPSWTVRDYYTVEDESGVRYWLMRNGDGVHPETGDLAWFLHGLY